ncbi:MAG: fibronectin type III domain-containing protein [Candidatus Zambryskibacteria bacterium]|nr:fibronectin type III domain-containing protein [Candidatus Zambryskibacteria bacterium]
MIKNKKNFKIFSIGLGFVLGAIFFTTSPLVADAAIARQLSLGISGSDITSLQTYLASDASIYPSGLVTGYFGQLTKAAVERFQTREGIVSSGTPATTGYGRVGPATLAALNQKMNGGVVFGSDNTAPFINSLSVGVTNTVATINWATNENAAAIVYYSTSPIPMIEGSATYAVTIGGSSLLVHQDLRTYHNATVANLQPNTTYYYVAYVRDGLGNETITWPATFTTTQ